MIDSSRLQAATPPYTLSRALHSSKDSRSSFSLALLLKQGLLWSAEASPHTSILNDRIRARSNHSFHTPRNVIAPFGAPVIDLHLPYGGLSSGVIHEWFSAREGDSMDLYREPHIPAILPLSLLALLIGNAACDLVRQTIGSLQEKPDPLSVSNSSFPTKIHNEGLRQWNEYILWNQYIFWIGKECWPSPYVLYRSFPSPSLLNSCIFIDVESDAEKLSLLDIILRSPATFAVTTHLKKLSLAQSKRLSLAINSQKDFNGRLAFICRPPNTEKTLSTAHTRWRVSPLNPTQRNPTQRNPTQRNPPVRASLYHALPPLAWRLTLLKQKGPQPSIREWDLLLRENIFSPERPTLNAKPSIEGFSTERLSTENQDKEAETNETRSIIPRHLSSRMVS